MKLPEKGIIFLKPNCQIEIRLNPSIDDNNIIGIKKYGDSILYDRKFINENLIWLSFIDDAKIRKYCYIFEDDIIVAPLKNGLYSIKNIYIENKFLENDNELFYLNFHQSTEYYTIKSSKSNKYLSVNENTFEINLINERKNDLQKWKIYRIEQDSNINIFRIENLFFNLYLTLNENNNTFILQKWNNLITQHFYIIQEKMELENENIEFNATNGIKVINKKLMEKNYKIKNIIIGNSVESIEKGSFDNCLYLEKIKCNLKWLKYFNNNNIQIIEINEGEKYIKKIDFIGFENITEISLPKSLIDIEENTFSDFNHLIKINADLKWYKYFHINFIEIPHGETLLKREIFFGSKYLKYINIPNTINEIEDGAFENSGIEEIIIPEGVQIIPENAFKNCHNLQMVSLPKSIINIRKTSFLNCPKLNYDNMIILNKNLNDIFKKEVNINSDINSIYDYTKYRGVDSLIVSINSKFKSEKDKNLFFKSFDYIIKGSFAPENLIFGTFTNLISFTIPEGIINIPENSFQNCINLEKLEISKDVLPHYLQENTFFPLTKLKDLKVPYSFSAYKDKLFQKCINLMKIKYLNGYIEKFKTSYKINDKQSTIKMDELIKIKNLGTLVIPESIISIEPSIYDLSETLECVECDPKWFKYLPIYQLKKIIIPEYVYIVDEVLFNKCDKLEEIIFKGDKLLNGNNCFSFENVKIFRCNSSIGTNPSDNLKNSKKIIYINDGTKIINKNNFKNWIGLENIYFPITLEIIEDEAFCGCINLKEIEIPKSVKFIGKNSFKNCKNIRKIKSKAEFLMFFPTNNVKEIILDENTKEIKNEQLMNFKNLVSLEIPEKFKIIPKNILSSLPRLQKIKCCPELLENLSPEDQRQIREIELYDVQKKINENILNQFINVQDIISHKNEEINPLKYIPHETNINDIIKFDENNIIYKQYIENILKDMKTGSITFYEQNDYLGQISQKVSEVCLSIKNFTGGKMSPHPVQCLSILRLINEILNGRGTLAQISTGEGKSYIISVVAIIFVIQFKRVVDIVTSNLELAFRDEQEQSDYYKLFGINSGVLCSNKGEEVKFINYYKKDYLKYSPNQKSGYFTHVLDYPIVYSTNYNFQFLHLFSFGEKEEIRKRKYDLVIIDEVDNMLIDQMISPAIIGSKFHFSQFKQIIRDIYAYRDLNEDIILNNLQKKYSKIADINEDIVEKLKTSARTAKESENEVDYIVENNSIYIIDKSTGYKKENLRWTGYIHELVESKENVKVKNPLFSFCSINQKIYFNKYRNICGVTGTLGDLNDQELLQKHYNVTIFKVPRHKPRKKPIYIKERSSNINDIFISILNEIINETNKGRPVLVIMDSNKNVRIFINNYLKQNKNINYGIIEGFDVNVDKKSLKVSGRRGQVTIATSAGGRGMDIKLEKESIDSGGLHVIIPFKMVNKRVEDQAIGRSGRQGQPGSVSIYRSKFDQYQLTPDFDPKSDLLISYQYNFIEHMRNIYSWVFNSKYQHISKVCYRFNTNVENSLQHSINILFKSAFIFYINGNEQIFLNCIYTSIMDAWRVFYNYVSWNIKEVNLKEKYNAFLNIIDSWFPKNLDKEQCFNYLIDKLNMRKQYNNIMLLKKIREEEEKRKKQINQNYSGNINQEIEKVIDGFLIDKMKKIAKKLFDIEVGVEIKNEIIIKPNSPKITCIFGKKISKEFNVLDTFIFKNKSITQTKQETKFDLEFNPLNLQIFDIFKSNIFTAKYSANQQFGELIENGSITIAFGFMKIEICFSFDAKRDSITSTDSITFKIEFDNIDPVLVPDYVVEKEKANNKQPYLDPFNDDIPEGFYPFPYHVYERDQGIVFKGFIARMTIYSILFIGPLAVGNLTIRLFSLLPEIFKGAFHMMPNTRLAFQG